MSMLTATVVNVALPALADDLDATSGQQQWVINAYLLMLGSFMLIGGSTFVLLARAAQGDLRALFGDLPEGEPSGPSRHTFVLPLVTQAEVRGAVVVTTPRPLDARVQRALEALGTEVSFAIESAALTEHLHREKSERRFRSLIENSSDLIVVLDDQQECIFASPVVERLLGAALSGAAYVTVRRLARTEHPLVIVFYFPLVTVPAALPGALSDLVLPTAREWLLLLAMAVAAQLGQIHFTRGLRKEPAGRATAVGYLQVVFAGIWGLIFFNEVPDVWSVMGSVVILVAMLLLTFGGGRAGPAAASTPHVSQPNSGS